MSKGDATGATGRAWNRGQQVLMAASNAGVVEVVSGPLG
jgi:hypothetical protein